MANVLVQAMQQSAITWQQATSDSTGKFAIMGLEPGTYSLRASGVGWNGELPDTITIDLGETLRNAAIPQIIPYMHVTWIYRLSSSADASTGKDYVTYSLIFGTRSVFIAMPILGGRILIKLIFVLLIVWLLNI